MTAIINPVDITFYGAIEEEGHEALVERNRDRLKSMGLRLADEANRGTDCHVELWSDSESLRLSGSIDMRVVDEDGEEVQVDDFDIWG